MMGSKRGFACLPAFLGQLATILALLASPEALRPNTIPKKPQHTLDDKLRPFLTAADVAHNDVQRFIREGLEHMEQMGIELSPECEKRYGHSFITNQVTAQPRATPECTCRGVVVPKAPRQGAAT